MTDRHDNAETVAPGSTVDVSVMGQPFVLDRVENPHPVMLREALQLRSVANRSGPDQDVWNGYLRCMIAATGCDRDEILDWLNRHEASA